MKIFKSGMKVLGIIALICVLALSFSPSKAFAQSNARTLQITGEVDIVDDEIGGDEVCNDTIDESITLPDYGKNIDLLAENLEKKIFPFEPISS